MLLGCLVRFQIECFCTVNFFRQLSKVVDRRVSLNIWWLLKILQLIFDIFFSLALIGWLLTSCFHFLVWGIPVHSPHPLEVRIIKLSRLIRLLPGLLPFFEFFVGTLSWFLNIILLRIQKGIFEFFSFLRFYSWFLLSLLRNLRHGLLFFKFQSLYFSRLTVSSAASSFSTEPLVLSSSRWRGSEIWLPSFEPSALLSLLSLEVPNVILNSGFISPLVGLSPNLTIKLLSKSSKNSSVSTLISA